MTNHTEEEIKKHWENVDESTMSYDQYTCIDEALQELFELRQYVSRLEGYLREES